jgi:hypothetical protein
MWHWTRSALFRYKISDFFSSLLEHKQCSYMYKSTAITVLAAVADRMNDFVNRHGVTNQFFDEDAAGKR